MDKTHFGWRVAASGGWWRELDMGRAVIAIAAV
jgi:hypothetical protein